MCRTGYESLLASRERAATSIRSPPRCDINFNPIQSVWKNSSPVAALILAVPRTPTTGERADRVAATGNECRLSLAAFAYAHNKITDNIYRTVQTYKDD